jgi:hypothetical protein
MRKVELCLSTFDKVGHTTSPSVSMALPEDDLEALRKRVGN